MVVTTKDPAGDPTALFGIATPAVPSTHVITIDDGVFILTSGRHTVTIRVSGSRGIDPIPMPQPHKP